MYLLYIQKTKKVPQRARLRESVGEEGKNKRPEICYLWDIRVALGYQYDKKINTCSTHPPQSCFFQNIANDYIIGVVY